MTSKTVATLIILALCLSMVSVLAPTLASPAQASPMQTLHLTFGLDTYTSLNYSNIRPLNLQSGDEIIQFTRPNLIVGTNPTGSFDTVARFSTIVTGDLSGTMILDHHQVNATWDELGTSKGYGISTFTFNDGYGNTFSGVSVADLDFPGGQYSSSTGYMVSTSGTGIFSGQVLIGTVSSDTNTVFTMTLRRYSSGEVSVPQALNAVVSYAPGTIRSLGSRYAGVEPSDELIQFTRADISIPPDDPVGYLAGFSQSGNMTIGNLKGTFTQRYNGIAAWGTTPANQGWDVGKFTYSDNSGTLMGITVADSLGLTGPDSPAGYGYSFALMGPDSTTGAYAGKDYYATASITTMGTILLASGNLYTLSAAGDNTPSGQDVTVSLPSAVVTFGNVTIAGTTTLTTSQGNPGGGLPSGFRLRGQFIDITTTATYSGPVTVCIQYDPSGVQNPQNLKLFHWNGTGWDNVTISIDPVTNTICGQISGLSPFFVGEEVAQTGEGCFIATAAYGSYLDSHVQTLRGFRDTYMMTNPVGRSLVSAYYKLSPPIAEFIDGHPALKPVVRIGLLPAVAASTVAVDTTMVEKMAIVGSLALVSFLMLVWLRKSRQNP